MKFGNLNIPPKKKKSDEGTKNFEGKIGDPTPEPIVMVNPVLSRQAGLKERKPGGKRKSISEGGDMYVPKVFSEPEPWQVKKETPEIEGAAVPAEEEQALRHMGEMESSQEVSEPQTHREKRQVLRRSVEELTDTIAARRAEISELIKEAEAPGAKETDRFKSFELERDAEGKVIGRKQNEIPPDVHTRIATAEHDLIAAEKELYAKQHPEAEMMRTAANDNVAEAEVPTATVAEGSNILTFPEATLAEWEARKASREGGEAAVAFRERVAPALEAKIAEEESALPFVGGRLIDSAFGRRAEKGKNHKGRKNFILAGLAALGLVTAPQGELAANTTHDRRVLDRTAAAERLDAARQTVSTSAKPEHIEIYSTGESATGEGRMTPASIEAERTRQSVFARAHPGERAAHLFARLRTELHAQYPKAEDAPDAVTRQILTQTPDHLARSLHFENAKGEAIMHGGYSLELSYNGQLVFFSPGRSTILMESTPESKEYPHGVHVVDTFHGRLTPFEHHTTKHPGHVAEHAGAHHAERGAVAVGQAAGDREAEGALDQRDLQAYEIEHPNNGPYARGLPGDAAGLDAVLREIRARRATARSAPAPITVERQSPKPEVTAAPPPAPEQPLVRAPEGPVTPPEQSAPAAPEQPQQPPARVEAAPAAVAMRKEHHVRPNGQIVDILWAVGGTYEERLRTADNYALTHRNTTVLFDASPDDQPGTYVLGFHSTGEGVVVPMPTVLDPDTNRPLPLPNPDTLTDVTE